MGKGQGAKARGGSFPSLSLGINETAVDSSWDMSGKYHESPGGYSKIFRSFVGFVDRKYAEFSKAIAEGKLPPQEYPSIDKASVGYYIESYIFGDGRKLFPLFGDSDWLEEGWGEEWALWKPKSPEGDRDMFSDVIFGVIFNTIGSAELLEKLSSKQRKGIEELGLDSYSSLRRIRLWVDDWSDRGWRKMDQFLGMDGPRRERLMAFLGRAAMENLRSDSSSEKFVASRLSVLTFSEVLRMSEVLGLVRAGEPELETAVFDRLFRQMTSSPKLFEVFSPEDIFYFLKSKGEKAMELDWGKMASMKEKSPGMPPEQIERVMIIDDFA